MPDHQTDPPPEKSESPSGEGVQEFASDHFVEEDQVSIGSATPSKLDPPNSKKSGEAPFGRGRLGN